jgi:hypothetical protein
VSTLLQDLRYAARSLSRNRGFTAVAVLTLALGVGANTAIFSVLQAIVLRDLPYREPDRLAVMWTWNVQQNLPDESSYLNFRDWKAQSQAFEQMAAYVRPEFTRATLTGAHSSERVHAAIVGPDFFEVLGTAPFLGRTFESAGIAVFGPASASVSSRRGAGTSRTAVRYGCVGRRWFFTTSVAMARPRSLPATCS